MGFPESARDPAQQSSGGGRGTQGSRLSSGKRGDETLGAETQRGG